MVSKNRVQKHILKEWSPIYALYPPMVHRRSFCGPGALGPRPTGEVQGPMARPAMGIRAQGSNGTPRWASRFPRLQGARNARNIYIYIYVYAYVCVLCETVVARRDMGRLIVKTNSTCLVESRCC